MTTMMRITRSQLDHFADRTRERFVLMMTEYIGDSFGTYAPAGGRAALMLWVRQGLAVCERYGVDLESEAAQLMLLLLVLGVDAAEREAWVREALTPPMAPVGKVRRLVAACEARNIAIDDVLVFREMSNNPGEAG